MNSCKIFIKMSSTSRLAYKLNPLAYLRKPKGKKNKSEKLDLKLVDKGSCFDQEYLTTKYSIDTEANVSDVH